MTFQNKNYVLIIILLILCFFYSSNNILLAQTDVESTEKVQEKKRNYKQENVKKLEKATATNQNRLNRFWVLITAALVFLMQAGFKVFEMGMVREIHGNGIGMKNLIDWLVICLAYFMIGFAFMFGKDSFGFIGTDLFFPASQDMEGRMENVIPLGLEFLLFQLAFASTAATIVSGAMSERTALLPYLLTSIFVGVLVYPIFGHWAWGNLYYADNVAWLYDLGFRDFAGSTVVHSVGAWVSLVGVWFLGPRIGRYDDENKDSFKPYSLGYSVLGVFILWFGWWGFNGGSHLAYEEKIIGSIILNTNLAAAGSGLMAFFHSYFTGKENIYEKFLGGVLGGLVAITASCNIVSPMQAILVGLIAGLVHNYCFDLLNRFKIDDPVGAIPVHGACGVWGTLFIGFVNWDGGKQLLIQFIGILVAFAFSVSLSIIFFWLLKTIFGLRVNPKDELETGYNLVPQRRASNK